jgi:hypothetical protein
MCTIGHKRFQGLAVGGSDNFEPGVSGPTRRRWAVKSDEDALERCLYLIAATIESRMRSAASMYAM